MPKESKKKASQQLRHAPLGDDIQKPSGKVRNARKGGGNNDDDGGDDGDDDGDDNDRGKHVAMPNALGAKIYNQAKEQRREMMTEVAHDGGFGGGGGGGGGGDDDDDDDDDEGYDEYDDEGDVDGDGDDDDNDPMVDFEGEYVCGAGLSEQEEAVVQRFLHAGRAETRTLADIIMDKIKEKEEDAQYGDSASMSGGDGYQELRIPPKVAEVYTSVGKMLAHYKAGKLPKALKMLPHLKNWEDVLWLTRPDEWSPSATYACTRIFASNLNEKMAQRFFNLVLLEKCRDDIHSHNKLNYHYYMALKKALFKPAAFYKGLLLPLAQSRTCSLREATIIGSVLAKVSVPGNHSAAALLRLAEMPYSGSTSLFVRVLLHKKYALPRRVIDALVKHFCAFEKEAALLPVIWHQALLTFVQRYKLEFEDAQRERLKGLCRVQNHHQITLEVKRELTISKE